MWKCALLEKARKSIAKKLEVDFCGTVENIYLKIAHDTIQCLKNVVDYLNMKMPDILVEMIYLKKNYISTYSSEFWSCLYH